MATREKKLSVGRKQNTSIPSAKEEIDASEVNKNEEDNQILTKVSTPTKGVSSVKKLINKTVPKKLKKKAIVNVKLKPTLKVKTTKLKQRMITSMLKNSNNVNAKKKLVKNPAASGKPKKTKFGNKTEDTSLQPVSDLGLLKDDEPDKQLKKKNLKSFPKSINISKKTITANDENLTVEQATVKKTYKRKLKTIDHESTDEVMNDLSTLLANTDVKIQVKEEPIEVAAEIFNSDLGRLKKIAKRKKKVDTENTLSILSSSDRKVIDRLDLNVNKMEDLPSAKRRHSIEKFPVSVVDSDSNSTNKLFINNLSECNIPRSRNSPRLRQSADRLCRRSNPYKTRSEARTLRSGKDRKLNLLEGIRASRRRRRNYSEYSGSEKSFPKSEYESDSSISDMSSLHGAEQNDKDTENIKPEIIESCDESVVKIEKPKIRKSRSHESNNFTDTNSNLYVKETKTSSKNEEFLLQLTGVSPSLEMPQKSMILDIMKQTFNVIFDAKDVKYLKSQAAKQNAQLSVDGESETDEIKSETCKQTLDETLNMNEIQDIVKVEENLDNHEEGMVKVEKLDNNEQDQNKIEADFNNINEKTSNNYELENSSSRIDRDIQDTGLAEISDTILSEGNQFSESLTVKETGDKLSLENDLTGANLNDSVNSETDDVRKAIDEVYPAGLDEENQEEAVMENENQDVVVKHEKDTEPEEHQLQNGNSDLPADYETPENLTIKENILQALGLQSNKAAKEANLRNKEKSDVKSDIYTGSLKTVIKISRLDKKRGRNLKMGLHKNRKSGADNNESSGVDPSTEVYFFPFFYF